MQKVNQERTEEIIQKEMVDEFLMKNEGFKAYRLIFKPKIIISKDDVDKVWNDWDDKELGNANIDIIEHIEDTSSTQDAPKGCGKWYFNGIERKCGREGLCKECKELAESVIKEGK